MHDDSRVFNKMNDLPLCDLHQFEILLAGDARRNCSFGQRDTISGVGRGVGAFRHFPGAMEKFSQTD